MVFQRVRFFTGTVLLGWLLCTAGEPAVYAQQPVAVADTVIQVGDDALYASGLVVESASRSSHNPSKATLMSTVLPGLGQAYNRKYWKIPIIYAALGISTYFYISHNNNFQKYRQAYIDYYDTDESTHSYLDFDIPRGVTIARYITVYKDGYRKWRDWAGIAVLASYVLNIVDATVDAHFFDFNIDDNLSMTVHPQWMEDVHRTSRKWGVHICFSF